MITAVYYLTVSLLIAMPHLMRFNLVLMIWISAFSIHAQVNADPTAKSHNNDCVIVLHGMGRTAYSMNKVAEHLQGLGFAVWNESYSSLSATIEDLSQQAIIPGVEFCRQQSASDIHFVTHSLGGILLRQYLQPIENEQKPLANFHTNKNELPELGSIVMLSPPNHGSEVVDEYQDWWLFRTVMGPAFLQLSTEGFVRTLKPIPGVIGIITGNESSDPWFSGDIPGPDDGKVSVDSAKLDEMSDFLVMPVGHTFIMSDEAVLEQIAYFLKMGRFKRPND